MSVREIIALGTASQVPTRLRNHNGYFLRWDDEGFLFDPGEGTQRQMAFASLASSSINRVCVTHFHGDHCLGLGGIIQRASLDRITHPLYVHFPASGAQYFERLRYASIYYPAAEIVPSPVRELPSLAVIADTPTYTLYAHALDHGVPTIGYRLEEKSGRRFVPELLAAAGVSGPLVGALSRQGSVTIDGRTVTVDQVSTHRRGSVVAFVMDTRPCAGALALARDADILVMEATYTAEDQSLATEHGHSSSADAARTALEANAKQLAITHFSQRYASTEQHVREARAIFENTIALHDLDRLVIRRDK
jgi:ribonuclease Z